MNIELTFVIIGSIGGGRGRNGAVGGSTGAVFGGNSSERCYVAKPGGGHGGEISGGSATESEVERRSERKKR
ncbi:hypothetical protein L195_g052113 [Trifolium pratense]|uniref:Uncharacterized protein n=1 Tax=Trifolium pratense TaxID=57577 RepID=A0A2K3K3F8_TRIPR|nr:hypothetical protein L195_g052113 [Trifolium pratense]